jgi:hypothetical protein
MFLGIDATVLGDPCGGSSWRRHERVAKDAGGARVDERLHACGDGLFQQIERARQVGVDEIQSTVRSHVGLVQGSGMEDRLHAIQTTPHQIPIGDGADVSGKWRRQDVETNGVMLQAL